MGGGAANKMNDDPNLKTSSSAAPVRQLWKPTGHSQVQKRVSHSHVPADPEYVEEEEILFSHIKLKYTVKILS